MVRRFVLVTLCFVAAPIWADVGDLSPIAPTDSMPSADLQADPRSFSAAKAGSGTAHPRAVVGKCPSGKSMISVAIDARTADAQGPNCLRLDFTGKGRFNDEHVVSFSKSSSASWQRIGPGTIQVERNGAMMPVTVSGWYRKEQSYRFLRLEISSVMAGDCSFGDTVRRVRLIDGGGNLAVNDAARVTSRGGRMTVSPGGDTVQVDLGDGSFTGESAQAYYGHPMLIGGKWWKLSVSSDGSKVSAAAMDTKSGQVQIDHDRWSATVANARYIFRLTGGRDPLTLPKGSYQIINFTEFHGEGRDVRILSSDNSGGKPGIVRVVADKTTKVSVGSPIVLRVKARTRGRQVRLDFEMADSARLKVGQLTGTRGRPKAPRVVIRNAKGDVVHQGTFEYG